MNNIQKWEQWMAEKFPNLTCPACQNKSFAIHTEFLALPETKLPPEIILTKGQSVISATCQNCAHVLLFGTKMMGLT